MKINVLIVMRKEVNVLNAVHWLTEIGKRQKNMSDSDWPKDTDAVGREKWWEERKEENDGLALKIFTGICCSQCMCKYTE